MAVKGRTKFIGRSVIVVHRLLKNSVPDSEYLLVTQDALDKMRGGTLELTEAFVPGGDHYEAIGEVAYMHRSLQRHHDALPPVTSGL